MARLYALAQSRGVLEEVASLDASLVLVAFVAELAALVGALALCRSASRADQAIELERRSQETTRVTRRAIELPVVRGK